MPIGISAVEPIEVDLWGSPYTAGLLTRTVSEKSQPLLDKLDEAQTATDMVEAIAKIIDLRVKPVNGGKKAATVIREKWKADEVSVAQLLKLMDDITEADRPT